jgi:hypothetical protein
MIALNVFGPALKYRLDLLKNSSYDVRRYVHILTGKISYEKFYQEFKDDYKFFFVEDYMSKYELSLKHEIIPNHFTTEKEHFENSSEWYKENNNFFSYDIHRFAMMYFLSQGIKNFVIIDSDLILNNDINIIDEFFKTIPSKCFYSPGMGTEFLFEQKNMFWNKLNYPLISENFKIPTNTTLFDGWLRGFNFETVEDGMNFFNLWNTSYLQLLEERQNPTVGIYKNGEGPLIWSNEWIFSHCVKIFEVLFGYDVNYSIAVQPGEVYLPNKKNLIFGKHRPRPEDNLFHYPEKYTDENGVERYPSRGSWYDFRFNYDCEKTVTSFIRKNKQELIKYYEINGFNVRATDTHIYTKIKK